MDDGNRQEPAGVFCPTLERRATDNATFTFKNYGSKWTPTNLNSTAYTGYDFWAGYPANLTPSNIVFGYQAPNLYNTLARTPRSNADTVLAADRMIIKSSGAWVLRNNHFASRKPLLKNHAGILVNVDFNGGNVLYNDGHVIWKDAAETSAQIKHGPDADYVTYFF